MFDKSVLARSFRKDGPQITSADLKTLFPRRKWRQFQLYWFDRSYRSPRQCQLYLFDPSYRSPQKTTIWVQINYLAINIPSYRSPRKPQPHHHGIRRSTSAFWRAAANPISHKQRRNLKLYRFDPSYRSPRNPLYCCDWKERTLLVSLIVECMQKYNCIRLSQNLNNSDLHKSASIPTSVQKSAWIPSTKPIEEDHISASIPYTKAHRLHTK